MEEYGISVKQEKGITAKAVSEMQDVFNIFSNNLFVLLFTLLFSLTFGAGAIFILAWNASVIATAIGMLVRINFLQFYLPFLMYLTHGIPEIAAYFLIALAGGILSTAVIRHDIRHGRMRILYDILLLVIISVLLLFLAALIEVFITPIIF